MRFLAFVVAVVALDSRAVEIVRYGNEAASIPLGARLSGVAGVALGLEGDPSHMAQSPAGLMDVDHPEVVFHHGSLYEDLALTQDEFFLASPLSFGTVGFGISRIGADGILRSERGEVPAFGANPSTFSATDWVVDLAFARAWFDRKVRGGASLKFLGRDLDQLGGGAQLDGSLVVVQSDWRFGLGVDRAMGGFDIWESGRAEYTPPDLRAGFGWEREIPYIYGKLALAWESAGLLRDQSNSTFSEEDSRPWNDPGLALRASRVAVELRTDFGLVLRAGAEIQAIVRVTDFLQGRDEQGLYGESRGEYGVGAGYLWSNRVRVDYSLVGHPDLGLSQRFSLGIVFAGNSAKPNPRSPAEVPPPLESKRDTIVGPAASPGPDPAATPTSVPKSSIPGPDEEGAESPASEPRAP